MTPKKNGQIHLKIESELLEKIKKEAKELGIPRAELIRIRLRGNPMSKEIILFRKIKMVIENGK
jgi:predicted DNA binding CopG/RHH family protein